MHCTHGISISEQIVITGYATSFAISCDVWKVWMYRKLGIIPASSFTLIKEICLEPIHVTQYDESYYKFLRKNELLYWKYYKMNITNHTYALIRKFYYSYFSMS